MPLKPDSSAWTFASGRATVLESRMAPAAFFSRVLDAPRGEDVLPRLNDTLLGDRLAGEADLRRADRAIAEAYRGIMEDMRALSPDPGVADLLLLREDLRSLKNFVKRTAMGLDVSQVACRYGEDVWARLAGGLETDVPEMFGEVLASARAAHGADAAPDVFDAAFDSASLVALCEAARRTGSEFVAGYWERYDAARGVESLWRARALEMDEGTRRLLRDGRQDAEFLAALEEAEPEEWPSLIASAMSGLDATGISAAEGTDRIRAFVHAADEWLMDYTREARMVPFGPERVFGCLAGLEAEAHNMRVAVVGRANNVSPQVLRGHLRALYSSGSASDGR